MSKCTDCNYTTCNTIHRCDSAHCLLSGWQLCDACTKIVELECRMGQLHLELVDFARQKLELKTAANQRHDLLRIHRLPPEIASHIFSLYVEEATTFSPPPYKNNWRPGILLASVCKTWRNVALSTPQIWSSPNIFLRCGTHSLYKLVELCLQRSRALPLKLYISTVDDIHGMSWFNSRVREYDPLLEVLSEHVDRLISLCITDFPEKLAQRIFEKLKSTPVLQDLGIFDCNDGDEPRHRFSLLHAPLLKQFGVAMLSLDQLDVPWSNLISFSARQMTANECREVLRRCENLVDCQFTGIRKHDHHFPLPLAPRLVTHLSLRDLYFEPGHEEAAIAFLNRVDLPNLSRLTYSSRCADFPMPTNAFLSLFARSNCQIRTFTVVFEYQQTTRDDYFRTFLLLEKLPTLRHLELRDRSGSEHTKFLINELFQRLAVTRASKGGMEPILPYLNTLTYSGPPPFSWANLVALFPHLTPWSASPCTQGSDVDQPYRHCLQQINIRFTNSMDMPYIDNAVMPRLLSIQKSGVSLSILSHDGRDLLQASLKGFYRHASASFADFCKIFE